MEEKVMQEQFFAALAKTTEQEDIKALFEGVCTPKEVKAMSQRFAVAKMLSKGSVYEKIVKETGASTATISRVNRNTLPQISKIFKED